MILKILRTNANLTQDQLADILGVKKSSIQKYESDSVSNLKRDTIRTICTYFNVPSYFFIFPELVKDEKELHKINIKDIYNNSSCPFDMICAAFSNPYCLSIAAVSVFNAVVDSTSPGIGDSNHVLCLKCLFDDCEEHELKDDEKNNKDV